MEQIKQAIKELNTINEDLINNAGSTPTHASEIEALQQHYDFIMDRTKRFNDEMLAFQHKAANFEIEMLKKVEEKLGVKL